MALDNIDDRYGIWFSTENIALAEIASNIGYQRAILDVEHGAFDLATLERFIPFLHSQGFDITVKVLAPERGPIQQALDFGANAVVIPHIENLAHAREICSFAKFPPLGKRSFAGGRTTAYQAPTDQWVTEQDKQTRCYPMIEDVGALEDVEQILALDTVDGVFIGPTDLSLLSGRGVFTRKPEDWVDLKKIANAANKANKDWVIPAWSDEEKQFAFKYHATYMALVTEHTAMTLGLKQLWDKTINLELKA